jgi:hypothetical protein
MIQALGLGVVEEEDLTSEVSFDTFVRHLFRGRQFAESCLEKAGNKSVLDEAISLHLMGDCCRQNVSVPGS